jgi:Predicted membrane protein
MKKHGLLKMIGIAFLALIVLTWIIPAGNYASGEYAGIGTSPYGIFDLTRIPLIAITNLVQYSIVLLVIGGLYGVLNKTGVYTPLIDSFAKKFKGKEKRILLISTLVFSLLSAVVGANFVVFMLVPFFVAVIMVLGFNKVTAMLSTVGAMMLGNLAAITNSDIEAVLMQYFAVDMKDGMLAKTVFFVMVVVLYILFVNKISKIEKPKTKKAKAKKETKTDSKTKKTTKTTKAETKKEEVVTVENKDIPLYDKNTVNKKKSFIPLIVIVSIIFVVSLVAMFNWNAMFEIKFFDEVYEKVMDVKIGDYTIIKNIFGTLSPFGQWTNYEFIMFLILCIPFIGWLYNVKFDDLIEGFVDGAKKLAKPAFYVLIANILYAAMFNIQTGDNIYYTIVNFFMKMSSEFNALVVAAISFIGGIIYSDFGSFAGSVASPITMQYTKVEILPLVSFIVQTIYGIVAFITPTSVMLVLGLTYFDISYKDWFKTIWKYLVKTLIILILVIIVVAMFI